MRKLLKQNLLIKPAAGMLMAGLILLLSLLGESPTLHKWIHADSDRSDHICVVTLFAKGQISSAPVVAILALLASFLSILILSAETLFLPSANYRYSASRAPPALRFSFPS